MSRDARFALVLFAGALAMLTASLAFAAALVRLRAASPAVSAPAAPSPADRGARVYAQYCAACHGVRGDGRGPSAHGMLPAPRDFTRGVLEFAAVPSGRSWRAEDVARTVRAGLPGTAMPAFDLPAEDLSAVIAHVRSFAPRLRSEAPGAVVSPTPDPWRGRTNSAIARGEALYHGLAQCWTCHPSYETPSELRASLQSLQGAAPEGFREDLHGAVLQTRDDGARVLPPDFLRRPLKGGDAVEDLYRTLSAGLGGVTMPAWRDVLPEEDIWAMAHYVRSLAVQRDTDAGRALLERLASAQRPPSSN